MIFVKIKVFFLLMLGSLVVTKAQLSVGGIFTNHMVLQQKAKVKIWGKSAAKETINLKITFLKKTINLVADDKGNWETDISTPQYGGPYEMVIEVAKNIIKIEDIYLGEVWLASGQSNMQFPLDSNSKGYNGPINFKEEVKNANYPSIRQFVVKGAISRTEGDAQQGEWLVCKPANAKRLSALAYFYARNLQQNLNVPIGIINASWGGTNIESWMSVKDLSTFESEQEKLKNITSESVKVNENYPSVLFNGMIHPFRKYTIKGVIWCQGENNINDPRNYAKKMESLIKGWRTIFEQKDLPFLYVQIAPFNYMGRAKQYFWGKDNSLGYLVEEQAKVLNMSGVFMARTGDVGDIKNIHYRNKQEVGQRLSFIALKEVYNKYRAITNGPNVVKIKYLLNKAIVYYSNIGNGLMVKGATINGFELSEDGINFYPANAAVDGKNISVSCRQLSRVTAVRYCFKNTQEVNLFNSAGLPALPFRTDNVAYQPGLNN